ncbi:hypothetical protein PAPYR_13308 [Paratrimastix pyriformis]|uniref:Uncharacterized protein n=1 Tax=Paratrimastix pyriformis TaxID=342808 RepID=A0ABQ8U1Y4_9EUKA|nr:hypothetical protein PAPYR_13308 [Paratrimastix pyriformis]
MCKAFFVISLFLRFTAGGVAAGSLAAAIQSMGGIGTLFSACQAVGAAGLWASFANVAIVSGVAGFIGGVIGWLSTAVCRMAGWFIGGVDVAVRKGIPAVVRLLERRTSLDLPGHLSAVVGGNYEEDGRGQWMNALDFLIDLTVATARPATCKKGD